MTEPLFICVKICDHSFIFVTVKGTGVHKKIDRFYPEGIEYVGHWKIRFVFMHLVVFSPLKLFQMSIYLGMSVFVTKIILYITIYSLLLGRKFLVFCNQALAICSAVT